MNEKFCEAASGKILIFSHYCRKVDPEPLNNRISLFLSKQTSSGFFPEVSFQKIFMKWVKECQKNDSCTIFLGDSHKVDENMHIQIENGSSTAEELLQSLHKDTDD